MKKLLALSLALIVLLSMSACGAEAKAANEEDKAAAAAEAEALAKEQAALAEIENRLLQDFPYCKVYSDNERIIIDLSVGSSTSELYSAIEELRDMGLSIGVLEKPLQTVKDSFLQFYNKAEYLLDSHAIDKELQMNVIDENKHDFLYLTIINDEITYDIFSELISEIAEPAETAVPTHKPVETPKQTPKPTPKPTTTPTMGEKNALKKAHQYLDYSAFSYTRLIEQLEFEGFSHEEAVYAVDHCGADWNKQAVKKAKQYLDYSSFSRSGLIDQLIYEGFTAEQAEYGVTQNGY